MCATVRGLLYFLAPVLGIGVTRNITMACGQRSLVAVCQMTSGNNKEVNFQTCKRLIMSAKEQLAQMVFLPEACDYIGENNQETLNLAEPLDGPIVSRFCELAKQCKIWLSLGGIHEKTAGNKLSNSHIIVDNDGKIKAVYRKTHLFDVDIPERGLRLIESDFVSPGSDIVEPIETPVGKVGLGVCYDVRFPEFSLMLSNMGADVLTYPSAFTFTTGSAHWETLLRARAIENQTYVIAAAQTGKHNSMRSSWGHAMIVDPWGVVIAQCLEGTNFSVAEIDHFHLATIRDSMPVRSHRRNNLYPKLVPQWRVRDNDQCSYRFGESSVNATFVFLKTDHTIAFTNKRCVVPGHVLVSPIRRVERFRYLDSEGVKDLYLTVQSVQKIVEDFYDASSSTISMQDGADAGQTIRQVHVHVLPRKPGDFRRNDDVYIALEHQETLQTRSEREMVIEAMGLRKYFY